MRNVDTIGSPTPAVRDGRIARRALSRLLFHTGLHLCLRPGKMTCQVAAETSEGRRPHAAAGSTRRTTRPAPGCRRSAPVSVGQGAGAVVTFHS